MSIIGFASYSQAQISVGDIAILGVNSDALDANNDPLYNELTIGTLATIPSGQTIFISDFPYTDTALDSTGPSTSEGYIKFVTTTSIPQGTVIKFTINGNHVIGGGLSTYGTVTAKGWDIDVDTDGTGDAIASGGDNWFIFTGSVKTPTFIYGYGNWGTGTLGTNWMTSGTPSTTTSYLPATLTNGLTANLQTQINVNHADNNVYSGIKSATKYNLLTAIATPANWTKSESVIQDITPGGSVLTGSNPILTIQPTAITVTGSLTSFATCAGSASVAQSFTVSATGLSENLVLTAPSGFEISKTSNNAGFGPTQSLSHTNGVVSSTTIYIRIKSIATGNVSGNVLLTSLWAADKTIAASGVVNNIPASPSLTSSPICGTGTVTFTESIPNRLAAPVSPYKLYDAAVSGNLVVNGLTTPSISQTTDYYATNTENGCESPRVKVTATVKQTTTGQYSITACDMYLFNGIIRTTSGAYKDTLVNKVGCDSIVTLNLTINSTAPPTLISTPICGEGKVTFEELAGTIPPPTPIKLYNSPTNGSVVGNGYTTPTITQTTDFYATQTLGNGCESARIKVTATVNQPSTGSFSQTACDKFFFNGFNRTTSGVYKDTLVNKVGCDSILTLNLTINSTPAPSLTSSPICGTGTVTFTQKVPSRLDAPVPYKLYDAAVNGNLVVNGLTTPSISQTTDYYATITQNNCESPRVKVTATVKQPTTGQYAMTACGMYLFNEIIRTTSGAYKDTLVNKVGCDSIVTLNLTVNPLPNVKANATPSRSIVLGNSITLKASGAVTYSWDNGVIDNSAFIPTKTKLYTVTGTDANNCTNTDTITVDVKNTTGLDITNENTFEVHPNPANDVVNIQFVKTVLGTVIITDLNGKKVYESAVNNDFVSINTKDFTSGIYLINRYRRLGRTNL